MAIETGQTYRSTLEVRQADGTLITPSTYTYTITLPDQTTAAGSVAVASVGHLTGDYTTVQAGLHRGKWVTTSPGTVKTDWFDVREFRSLLPLDEARDYLGILDTTWDEKIRSLLTGITRLIERRIGTCCIRAISGEFIPGDIRDAIRLPSGPLPTAASVTSIISIWAGGPAWAAADLTVDPDGSMAYPADGTPFTGGPWQATYTAGRRIIPDDVLEGAKEALWDLWATQRGLSADTIEPALDEVAAFETSFPQAWRLPPRVLQMLDGEHTPGFA
jgi:hypothetical protein